MRAILIVGMMAVAGSAWGQDFGINSEAANRALLRNVSPILAPLGCSDEFCDYKLKDHDIQITLMLSPKKVVDAFGVLFAEDNWAVASAVIRSVQKELFVPESEIVNVDTIARHAASGVKNDTSSPSVTCTSNSIPRVSAPYIECRRK